MGNAATNRCHRITQFHHLLHIITISLWTFLLLLCWAFRAPVVTNIATSRLKSSTFIIYEWCRKTFVIIMRLKELCKKRWKEKLRVEVKTASDVSRTIAIYPTFSSVFTILESASLYKGYRNRFLAWNGLTN